MLKTGFIQPETIPGHFPRNLRAIVELYRSCLDAGAELVLCLCSSRISFISCRTDGRERSVGSEIPLTVFSR